MSALLSPLLCGLCQCSASAKAEQAKRAAERLKARKKADWIEDTIAGRDPDANRDDLRKWSPWGSTRGHSCSPRTR